MATVASWTEQWQHFVSEAAEQFWGERSQRTGEPVSAQTVSQLTRALERLVEQFHHAPLGDHWRSLVLDGVSLKVRRPAGRTRLQLLVA